MKLVVGLGNPGKQYAGTRHNVGWMVLDRLADRAGWNGREKARDSSTVVWGRYKGTELMLAKPTTYMNLSGVAVRKLLARERAPLEDLLVVLDDFALPLGRLRLREAGSAGGHNGLRSIIGDIGNQKIARLRVGIGEPSRDAVDHVLSKFAPDERAELEVVLEAAADAVEEWAQEGIARAANRWNAWTSGTAAGGGSVAAAESDVPAPGEVGGAVGTDGVRRTRTGWRRVLDIGNR